MGCFYIIITTVVTERFRIIIENLMNIFLHKNQHNNLWKVLIVLRRTFNNFFLQQEIIYSFRVLFASRKQFSGEKLCNSKNQGLVFAHVFIISPGTKLPNYQKKLIKSP